MAWPITDFMMPAFAEQIPRVMPGLRAMPVMTTSESRVGIVRADHLDRELLDAAHVHHV